MRQSIFFILAVSLSLFALSGCKSPKEKACANLLEHNEKFGEEGDLGEEECLSMMGEVTKECENPDEILECIGDVDADDEDALGESVRSCFEKCDRK